MLSSSCATQRSISCPSCRARSASAPENPGALELGGQLGTLPILGNAPLARGDRAITGTDRDHPNLVRTRLRPDLGAPLLRIDAVRRADLPAAQQLRIIAAGSLEVVLGDPAKPLVVLRRHAESRSSPDTESEPTPTARRSTGAAARRTGYEATRESRPRASLRCRLMLRFGEAGVRGACRDRRCRGAVPAAVGIPGGLGLEHPPRGGRRAARQTCRAPASCRCRSWR